MRSTTAVRILLVCSTFAATAGLFAQEPSAGPEVLPNGLRLIAIDVKGAADVSMALALPVGWQHDPERRTGSAEVARWCIELAQRELPPVARLRVVVRPRTTLVWHSGPRFAVTDKLEFVRELLESRLEVTADEFAVAKSGVRLESDDQTWLYPGVAIEQVAWREILAGEPGGRQRSVPEEVAQLTREGMLERLRAHYRPVDWVLVVIGDLDAIKWPAERARLGQLGKAGGRPPRTVHDGAPARPAMADHNRIGGPFVTAAFRAPDPTEAGFLPFAVGMIGLRARAVREFRGFHGREDMAQFPLLAYRYWEDEPIARFNRRGHDSVTVADTRQKVAGFLADIGRRGLREREVEYARREVASTLAGPPFPSRLGPYLAVRARYLAMAYALGWPLDLAARAEQVGRAEVNRVLARVLAKDALHWFALKPIRRASPLRR